MSSAALEKSLDEIIGEKPANDRRGSGRPSRPPRRDSRRTPYARDSRRGDERPGDSDRWSHDRYNDRRDRRDYDDDYDNDRRYRPRQPSSGRDSRATRLRVANIHYDLSEGEVRDLFEKIGPVSRFDMRFDRAGRSEGLAYVTYDRYADAKSAIAEYDGQKALGQILEVEMDAIVPPPRQEGRDLASRIGGAPRSRRDDGPPTRRDGGRDGRGLGRAARGGQGRLAGSEKTSTRRGPVTAEALDAELDNYINQRNNGDAQKVAESGPAMDGGADGMQID